MTSYLIIQLVGMDIYVYGRYSGLDEEQSKMVKEEVASLVWQDD